MQVYRNLNDAASFLSSDHEFGTWTPVFGAGDANPEVVIVQKSPSPADVKGGRPLLGRDGLTIRRALVKRGVPYYVTYAVPFYKLDSVAKKKQGEACSILLGNELEAVGAHKILFLGPDAARWTPTTYSVPFRVFKDVEGRELLAERARVRVVHSSAAIAANPNTHTAFIAALDGLLANNAPKLVKLADESTRYRALRNRSQAVPVLQGLGSRASLDLETTGLDPYVDRILTVNVADVEGRGYAFPWELFSPSEWANFFQGKNLIFMNGTFDLKFLFTHDVHLKMAEDIMLMHSLIDETPGTHAMSTIAPKYLGVDKWGEMVDYDNLEDADFRTLGVYGARDADLTLRLANVFAPQVQGRKITKVLHEAQNALVGSEVRGVRIDRDRAKKLSLYLEGLIDSREEWLQNEYGLKNPSSPQQVARVLFDDLGVPENARASPQYGRRSTNEKVVGQYKEAFPAIAEILEYRNLVKAKTTYVDGLLAYSDLDGRYHSDFKLAATETGRLTEKLITLIPRPTGAKDANEGKRVQQQLRSLFIPDPGYVLVGGDHSQLEVRMVALLSGDRQLIEDVNTGRDIHAINAVTAFDLPVPLEPMETLRSRVEGAWSHERSLAKQATFTYLFGGGEAAIARQLNIPMQAARKIMTALRERYPRLADYQKNLVEQVRREGMVFSLWGRPRHFSYNKGMDSYVEREQDKEAINFPVQSSSTDINLKGFADLYMRGWQTLFPFHDAVYMQVKEKDVDAGVRDMIETMQAVVTGPVKFKVEVHVGTDWGQLG